MSRKRIDLLAPPFSGHLHPTLAMARGLAMEHEVRVLSTLEAQPAIRAAGLAGVSVLDDSDGALRSIVNPPHPVRSHPLRLHRQFRYTLAFLQRLGQELHSLYASARPDLMIADFTLPSAGAVARDLGIPWWTSLPSPCVLETPDGTPAYLGGLAPRAGWATRARDRLGRKLIRDFKRVTFSLYRREIAKAGVTRLYRPDGYEEIYSSDCVLALGVKELEFPRSWPSAVRFIGPMLYTPPTALPDPPFIAGRRHVLVTLGTHVHWAKDQMALEAERAARGMPAVTFHFSDGRQSGAAEVRGNFVRVPYVDYDRCLPRYDLVVHHGGSGVMYHCLRRGIPAIVYPVDYDQFDHAARLEAADAALRLRSPATVGDAVQTALNSTALAARCAEWAQKLAQSDPEHEVRKLVSELVGAGSGPATPSEETSLA